MKRLFLVIALLALSAGLSTAEDKITATIFKNPGCTCCDKYAGYLRENGFDVSVLEHPNMTLIKHKYGVREDLEGCHTMIVGGYVVEGHVPVGPIKRLLSEKPAIKGISLPGMPEGSPGRSGEKEEPFTIYSITGEEGDAPAFAKE